MSAKIHHTEKITQRRKALFPTSDSSNDTDLGHMSPLHSSDSNFSDIQALDDLEAEFENADEQQHFFKNNLTDYIILNKNSGSDNNGHLKNHNSLFNLNKRERSDLFELNENCERINFNKNDKNSRLKRTKQNDLFNFNKTSENFYATEQNNLKTNKNSRLNATEQNDLKSNKNNCLNATEQNDLKLNKNSNLNATEQNDLKINKNSRLSVTEQIDSKSNKNNALEQNDLFNSNKLDENGCPNTTEQNVIFNSNKNSFTPTSRILNSDSNMSPLYLSPMHTLITSPILYSPRVTKALTPLGRSPTSSLKTPNDTTVKINAKNQKRKMETTAGEPNSGKFSPAAKNIKLDLTTVSKSKVRTALFTESDFDMVVPTSSFYPKTVEKHERHVPVVSTSKKSTKRKPSAVYLCNNKRNSKRKYGQINAGVMHKIKKPKRKKANKAQLIKVALNLLDNSPLNEYLKDITSLNNSGTFNRIKKIKEPLTINKNTTTADEITMTTNENADMTTNVSNKQNMTSNIANIATNVYDKENVTSNISNITTRVYNKQNKTSNISNMATSVYNKENKTANVNNKESFTRNVNVDKRNLRSSSNLQNSETMETNESDEEENDLSKKFFKSKKRRGIVTINKNIQINMENGKFKLLDRKASVESNQKKEDRKAVFQMSLDDFHMTSMSVSNVDIDTILNTLEDDLSETRTYNNISSNNQSITTMGGTSEYNKSMRGTNECNITSMVGSNNNNNNRFSADNTTSNEYNLTSGTGLNVDNSTQKQLNDLNSLGTSVNNITSTRLNVKDHFRQTFTNITSTGLNVKDHLKQTKQSLDNITSKRLNVGECLRKTRQSVNNIISTGESVNNITSTGQSVNNIASTTGLFTNNIASTTGLSTNDSASTLTNFNSVNSNAEFNTNITPTGANFKNITSTGVNCNNITPTRCSSANNVTSNYSCATPTNVNSGLNPTGCSSVSDGSSGFSDMSSNYSNSTLMNVNAEVLRIINDFNDESNEKSLSPPKNNLSFFSPRQWVLDNPLNPNPKNGNPETNIERDLILSPTSQMCNMASGLALNSPKKAILNINSLLDDVEKRTHTSVTVEMNSGKKLFPIFSNEGGAKVEVRSKLEGIEVKRGKKWKSIPDDQYFLDAGQKKFGLTQCNECETVYHAGDPNEEISHQELHNSTNVLKFAGWKNERVVGYFKEGRILKIVPGDSKSWWKKVRDLSEVINRDLGYYEQVFPVESYQIYLCILNKQIVGCLMAEPKSVAYKMVESNSIDVCSEESYPVKCGISRIWVAPRFRKKSIATAMVHVLRRNFAHGLILNKEDLALSSPTEMGKIFAKKFFGTENYLIYLS